MNDLLRLRINAQHGVFTVRDAQSSGCSPLETARLVATGAAFRVGRGAYVDGPAFRAGSPEQRHALAVRATIRARSGVAASHYSALVLHGLPVFGADLGRIHVARLAPAQNRESAGVATHRSYGRGSTCTVDRTPSVVVALGVIGTAIICGVESGVVAADAALARGPTTPTQLSDYLQQLRHTPGLATARKSVELADGRSESVGESRARVLMHALDIEAEPQVVVRDRRGVVVARVDFILRRHRVVVEFDGLLKYAGADGRQALAAEKRREDALRALGYEVVRLTWSDLSDPERVRSLLLDAIVRARRAA